MQPQDLKGPLDIPDENFHCHAVPVTPRDIRFRRDLGLDFWRRLSTTGASLSSSFWVNPDITSLVLLFHLAGSRGWHLITPPGLALGECLLFVIFGVECLVTILIVIEGGRGLWWKEWNWSLLCWHPGSRWNLKWGELSVQCRRRGFR